MDQEPDFFSDPQVIADSKGYFDLKRAQCPLSREPHHGTMMATGYDEVVEILTSKPGTFSSACSVVGPIPPLPFTPQGHDIAEQLDAHRHELPWSDHLACWDGKKHADHRALLGSLLTYTRLKQNEGYLYELADRLIDGFIVDRRCSVMPQYAHATTVYAISDLMGIPQEDRPVLLKLIGAPPSQIDGDAPQKVGPDPLAAMKPLFDRYLAERIDQPRGDLMSELVNIRFKDGSKPDFDTISALTRFLFGAGQDTTSHLIAMAILVLGEDQELQDRLRREPGRVGDFIEETLRHDPPVKVAYRLALVDTAIRGIDVPAGTLITVCLTGASNDPKQFAEPEKIDIDRPGLRNHLGFSRGVHGCLGAPLGRMESRVTIERLLARTSAIRISEEHHGPKDARRYRFDPTYSFRSLSDLHIEFDPA